MLYKRLQKPSLNRVNVNPPVAVSPANKPITRQTQPFRPQNQRQELLEVVTPDFLALVVTNSGAAAQKLVLFDADGAYANNNSYSLPADLAIRGITKNYDILLNRLTKYGLTVKKISMKVADTAGGSPDLTQFDEPIHLFKDSAVSDQSIYRKTFYPSMGEHSNQQRTDIQEFPARMLIEPGTALICNIQPTTIVTFKFFLDGELGRHQ